MLRFIKSQPLTHWANGSALSLFLLVSDETRFTHSLLFVKAMPLDFPPACPHSEGYRRTQEVSGWQGGVSRSAAVQVFMDRMLMHPVLGYLAKDNPKRSYCAPKAKSAHP
ncbi:MAG: hypothetical protein CVT98_10565 [Bacteroidetes bacterium HGW-Bacteroidetes-15]|nr:MAG: hypothetical protein CVT98_10565 [Bacteroidetes bacterium HGW-Bacteroidetes-15]